MLYMLLLDKLYMVFNRTGFCNSFALFSRLLVLQQNRLRQYGHVLRKDDDDDWVKKCMEYEGSKAKRKTKEDLERGCPRGLSRER